MQMLREETTDFSRGMDDSSAATAFPADAVQMLQNGRIQPDGTVRVRGGTQRAHAAPLTDSGGSAAQGYGAVEFRTTAGVAQWVVFIGDRMYYSTDEGATWTSPAGATGLRVDYWSLVTMEKAGTVYLLCANGSGTLYKWDGATWSAEAGPAAGIKYLAVFNGRLYASNGRYLYASAIADFSTWPVPSGLFLQIHTHDGEPITALYQIGPHLLVFKRSSTAYVDGFGNADIVVAAGATGFSRSVGCVAFRSIVGVGDNAACWLSERGVEYYEPGKGIQLRSSRVQKFFRGVAWGTIQSNPGMPSAAYSASSAEYHLALPTTGLQNNRTVVLNLITGAVAIDKTADADGGTLYLDGDGFLSYSATAAYYEARSVGGYLTLVTDADAGEPIGVDAGGFLTSITVDWRSATLFTADRGEEVGLINAVGYDGYVRWREYGTKDNAASDGTGGAPIAFVMVTRPYLLRSASRTKWVRVAYIAAIADEEAEVQVALRAGGRTGALHQLTIPPTAFGQAKRRTVKVSGRGDAPQLEIRTTDQVRFTLAGVEGHVLREVA